MIKKRNRPAGKANDLAREADDQEAGAGGWSGENNLSAWRNEDAEECKGTASRRIDAFQRGQSEKCYCRFESCRAHQFQTRMKANNHKPGSRVSQKEERTNKDEVLTEPIYPIRGAGERSSSALGSLL